ncbi:Os09g0391501 [Oryza sativa Japonica Group]|uniref:Os09g0391501 protein n=3 Tax=Oryza TaxID=4527 RepID=A0A0P0XM70_ORYSJ|nr:hypothetical protein EE612_047559 [Oryza sativa]BAT07902.1 Os09g0391501 [Oryza sativa Japonica Group]
MSTLVSPKCLVFNVKNRQMLTNLNGHSVMFLRGLLVKVFLQELPVKVFVSFMVQYLCPVSTMQLFHANPFV